MDALLKDVWTNIEEDTYWSVTRHLSNRVWVHTYDTLIGNLDLPELIRDNVRESG